MHEIRRLKISICLAFLPFLAAGCSPALPPKTDVKEANVALIAALDTWKDGGSADSLRERKPAIDFRDTSWESGSKLTKYVLEKEETFGLSARFTVKLSLVQASGEQRDRRAVYNVDAGTTIVIRPDF